MYTQNTTQYDVHLTSMTLHGIIEERDEWVEAINARCRPLLRLLSLGEAAPVWVPDDRAKTCHVCDVSLRYHVHCSTSSDS